MRLLGWFLLLTGLWSVWQAVTAGESLGWGGIVVALLGFALLTPTGQAGAVWLGQGLLTGLSFTLGISLVSAGVIRLRTHITGETDYPLRLLVIPLLFVGWGALVLLPGIRRLLRGYRAF